MKQHYVSLLALMIGSAACAQNNTPVGLWQSVDAVGKPKALIRITEHDGEYTGRIEQLFRQPGQNPSPPCIKCKGALKDAPVIGLTMLTGIRRNEHEYGGGEILDPEVGEFYRCNLTVAQDGKTMKVLGYLGMPLLGRTFVWQRKE
jgi:uncharacterized protein (DUF2147 family)